MIFFVKQALLDDEQSREEGSQVTFLLTVKALHCKKVVGVQEFRVLPPVLIVEGKFILLAIALSLPSSIIIPRKQRTRKTPSLTQEEEMKCLLRKLD